MARCHRRLPNHLYGRDPAGQSADTVGRRENGLSLEEQELIDTASSDEVEAAVVSLRQQYEPRISEVARRAWRFGRNACLTTSWCPREPSPDDPAAA